MTVLSYVFGGILLVCALFLIVAVLFQDTSKRGLSGAIAGGSDTFLGKNKGQTAGKKLSKLTAIAAIVFVVAALATYLIG